MLAFMLAAKPIFILQMVKPELPKLVQHLAGYVEVLGPKWNQT